MVTPIEGQLVKQTLIFISYFCQQNFGGLGVPYFLRPFLHASVSEHTCMSAYCPGYLEAARIVLFS